MTYSDFRNIGASFLLVFFCSTAAWSQCTKDIDCKGDRICESGICIAPHTQQSSTPPTPLVRSTSADAASVGSQVSASVESILKCLSPPSPSKIVGELQKNGFIQKRFTEDIDSIAYFKVIKPFQIWGLDVSYVFGFDQKSKIFQTGPGTIPTERFGVVVPYSIEKVKRNLHSYNNDNEMRKNGRGNRITADIGIRSAIAESLMQNPQTPKESLTEIVCIGEN